MRIRASFAIRSLLLLAAVALVASPAETEQRSATASCKRNCRGLGIEKVKAGDEHCGLLSRERKDEALDAACTLAESHREELQRRAQEEATGKCEARLDSPDCLCRSEMRRWQNVYTHVLSQRCWTECGWAFLVECERRPADEDG